MKIYKFQRKQLFKTSLDKLWEYLSSPKNLDDITLKELKFKITSELPVKMYAGQLIVYKIQILPFLNRTWVTEIKNVIDMEYFIDEQRFGPYKFWHHQHKLEKSGNNVIMHDFIHYAIPFGILGQILNFFFIRKKLENIFQYRFDYLDKKFDGK